MAPGALCSSAPSSSFRRPVDQSSAGGDHRFGGPLLPMTKKQSKTRTCLQLGRSVSPLVYVCGAARRTYEIEKAHGLSGRPATAIRASDSLNEPCFNFLAGGAVCPFIKIIPVVERALCLACWNTPAAFLSYSDTTTITTRS